MHVLENPYFAKKEAEKRAKKEQVKKGEVKNKTGGNQYTKEDGKTL